MTWFKFILKAERFNLVAQEILALNLGARVIIDFLSSYGLYLFSKKQHIESPALIQHDILIFSALW